MELKENELHIWRYNIQEADYETEKQEPLLSQKEKERIDSFLFEKDKIKYTCHHRVIRRILAPYLKLSPAAIEFSHAPMGKPLVKNSDLFFNYSYRNTFGLLAITKQSEVGVDIEEMKELRDLKAFTDFSFSEKENEIIFNAAKSEFQNTLFTFWTLKEAIIKSLGVGLNADLTKIDLSAFFYSHTNPLSFDNNTLYTIKNIHTLKGYKAAYAIKGTVDKCLEFNFG